MNRVTNVQFIKADTGYVKYMEISGLSTDAKPTEGVATGSSFLEVDTADVYFYDEESEGWIKAGGGE